MNPNVSSESTTLLALPALRVQVSCVEDCRRAVFLGLQDAGLSPARQRAVALGITDRLRAQGLLASSVEQLYKASEVALLVSRSPEYVVKEAKRGGFGVAYRDDGGWLIPASGVQAWLGRRVFSGSVSAPKEALAA